MEYGGTSSVEYEVIGSELVRIDPEGVRCPLSWADVADLRTSNDRVGGIVARISSKSANVQLHLTGESLDSLALHVEATFGAQAQRVRLGQTHVILGTACHPLQQQAVASAFEAVSDAGLSTGKISLGQYQDFVVGFSAFDLLTDDVHLDPNREAERASTELTPVAVVNATLYPYQEAGSAFIRSMAGHGVGTLIADEMGLGKTLQAITLLAERQGHGPSLVVAPAALLLNWDRELTRFAPHLRCLLHAGSHRAGVTGAFASYDVVITSYETLTNDLIFMGDVAWDVAILDEAQAIKNPESRRAVAVKALSRRVGIAITGTPVENGLSDIWSIVEFVVPSVARHHQAAPAGRERDLNEAERTGRAVAPVVLRRRVAEVGSQLPERVDNTVAFELTPAMRERYDAITTELGQGLPALQAQRQFCALGDSDRSEAEIKDEPKLNHLLEAMEELASADEKALVFTSFTLGVDRLVARLRAIRGINLVAPVDGRSDSADRQALIDEFAQVSGAAVLVMNPKAAGVGLNITAANHVFHFNPEWNPAATDQGTARAHRTGQQRTVFVHEFFYAGTVEEDAVVRAGQKRDVAEAVEAGVREVDKAAQNEGKNA